MHNYSTVSEKAAEWNLSARHIQNLCRQGKIKNAIKLAGSWFIPANAHSPAKNSKRGGGRFDFTGTKKKIFESAIELFTRKGYDTVTIRDIAREVGIQQSTIYNHFASKQEILDAIYNFYRYQLVRERPCPKKIEAFLKNERPIDIIRHLRYGFHEEHRQRMLSITKIIFQRVDFDEQAKKIAKTLVVDEGVRLMEDVFNAGIARGRFAPFDTHIVSVYINSIRVYTLYHWLVDPQSESFGKLLEDEQKLYEFVADWIPDLTLKNAEP